MNKWLWSLLCVTLLGAAACSDDDTEGDSGNPIPPALSTENLPDAGLKFLYSALTPHTFTMNVDAPWEITKTAGWFVVTPNKGEAGQNIQVTVTPALNQGEARDGEFTIRANSGNNLHPCLTEKSIPLSQDAYLAAGIVITGLDERLLAFEAEDTDPVVFTVETSYDWTLTVENETWLTVAPKSGKAGSAAQVTITPKANTTDERHESKITITAGDAEFGENTAEEIIELVQAPYMPKDTHAEGYVFFSDDFQWIPDNWVSPYTKYGWPSVSIDGTNGNEFALSTDGMKEAVAAKGYTYTPSVYARYEGHVKLGKTANMGAITIPALTGIDAGKAATLLVQFDAAAYSSAGGTVDNGDDHMDVTIEGLTDNTLELSDNPTESGAEVKFTVNAPYPWTIAPSGAAAWYEVSPGQGAANTDVEVTVKALEQNLSFRRFGEFTITAAEGDATLTEKIALSQQPVSPGTVKWNLASPVQWSFSEEDMGNYAQDFKGGPDSPYNTVLAQSGPGYLSYTHTAPSDPDKKCERIVGSTGHPDITGGWPGDYWTFAVPVTNLDAGTKVRFTAITRTSATGHKFWRMEYNDGGTWKPAAALQTTTETGEEVSYTHAMKADGTTYITVDVTVTYANAISGGNIEFRFVCAANWQANGKGALTKPNGGTIRWGGAGTADSPRIQIVP